MNNFTFGLDPEFMVYENGNLISAIPHLPCKSLTSTYYYDNVLSEIVVKPGATKEQSKINTKTALKKLTDKLGSKRIAIQASATYPQKEINCFEAKVAACNEEWDVYTLQSILPPDVEMHKTGYYQFKSRFRSAGGHIHLGSDKLQGTLESLDVVRMMDLFVAIPSLYLDTDETSLQRRKLYGKAGSYRTPEHGIEYRTLGNFWLASPELFELIYDLSKFSFDFVQQGLHKKFWHCDEALLDEEDPSSAFTCIGYDSNCLQECIKNCDLKQAEMFMLFINNYLPKNLIDTIEKLAGKKLPDPYETWQLEQ